MLHPDLQHVQREQKAAQHPMSRAKIARLANPVQQEQPNATRVAKENLVTKVAPLAKSAKKVLFKIKTHYQAYIAKPVPLDSTTVPKD